MPLSALLTVLRAAGRAGVPVLLWGTPGTGKSALIETLGRLDGLHTEVVIGSLREPADLNGLPVVQNDGSVVLAPPRWARTLVDAGGGYLFLDELSTAPPSVQAAMLRVVNDRVVGDLVLPSDTRIIAAANPVDTAAGGWELEPPTANRFLHLDYAPDLDLWCDGMTVGFDEALSRHGARGSDGAAGVHNPVGPDPTPPNLARATGQVVGFLRSRRTRFDECPQDPGLGGRGWPSPRSWDHLRRVLAHLPPTAIDEQTMAATGLVGEAAGVEFATWLRHHDLPDPAAVLDGTVAFDPDDRPDRLFAILSGLASLAAARGTADDWTRAWELISQVSVDVAATAARALFRCRPDDAPIPQTLLRFEPVLRKAGILAA